MTVALVLRGAEKKPSATEPGADVVFSPQPSGSFAGCLPTPAPPAHRASVIKRPCDGKRQRQLPAPAPGSPGCVSLRTPASRDAAETPQESSSETGSCLFKCDFLLLYLNRDQEKGNETGDPGPSHGVIIIFLRLGAMPIAPPGSGAGAELPGRRA